MKYILLFIKLFIIINSTLGLFINVHPNSLVFLNKKLNNLILYNNKPNNINPDKDKNKSKIYKMNYNNDDLENYENDYNNLLIKIYIFLVFYYYVLFNILNIKIF